MADKKKRVHPFRHWPVDILYALVVVFISGVFGRAIANVLSDTIAAYITAGALTLVISIALLFLIPFILRSFFRDEMEDVTSSVSDLILCCAVIFLVSYLCRDLIGPTYLTDAVFAVIGLIISYLCLLKILMKKVKKAI